MQIFRQSETRNGALRRSMQIARHSETSQTRVYNENALSVSVIISDQMLQVKFSESSCHGKLKFCRIILSSLSIHQTANIPGRAQSLNL